MSFIINNSKMAEPTITSNIEVLPENFWDRHFPEAKWENRTNEKIINRRANSHQEELKTSLKNYPINPNTTEIFCKYPVLYIRTKDNKYDDTIIKNLSAKKLSPENLEKYSVLLELMGKLEAITKKYEQTLRNLTNKELNSIDEAILDELILEDESEQEKWFQQFMEKSF